MVNWLPEIVKGSGIVPITNKADFDWTFSRKCKKLVQKIQFMIDPKLLVPTDEEMADRTGGLPFTFSLLWALKTRASETGSNSHLNMSSIPLPQLQVSYARNRKDTVFGFHWSLESYIHYRMYCEFAGIPCSEKEHSLISQRCTHEPSVECMEHRQRIHFISSRLGAGQPLFGIFGGRQSDFY